MRLFSFLSYAIVTLPFIVGNFHFLGGLPWETKVQRTKKSGKRNRILRRKAPLPLFQPNDTEYSLPELRPIVFLEILAISQSGSHTALAWEPLI